MTEYFTTHTLQTLQTMSKKKKTIYREIAINFKEGGKKWPDARQVRDTKLNEFDLRNEFARRQKIVTVFARRFSPGRLDVISQ